MRKLVPNDEQIHPFGIQQHLFGVIMLTKLIIGKTEEFITSFLKPKTSHFQNSNTSAREKDVEVTLVHRKSKPETQMDADQEIQGNSTASLNKRPGTISQQRGLRTAKGTKQNLSFMQPFLKNKSVNMI